MGAQTIMPPESKLNERNDATYCDQCKGYTVSLIWFQVSTFAAPAVALQTINFLTMNTRADILVNLASAIDPELACLNLWLYTIRDYPL